MYAYFIDDWTSNAKYKRELDKLDLWLTQHNIVGRKVRLGRLHDLEASIEECLLGGTDTVVAVGDDATASKVLNSFLKLYPPGIVSKDVGSEIRHTAAFAVLPVARVCAIAAHLGYSSLSRAVEALAQHQTKTIDLGKLNDRHYFITAAVFPKKVSLGFHSYKVSSLHRDHQISVCNMREYELYETQRQQASSPSDGTLEAVIAYRPGRSFWVRLLNRTSGQGEYIAESIFPIKRITVHSKPKTIHVAADIQKMLSTPVEVVVVPKALEVVVGGGCTF